MHPFVGEEPEEEQLDSEPEAGKVYTSRSRSSEVIGPDRGSPLCDTSQPRIPMHLKSACAPSDSSVERNTWSGSCKDAQSLKPSTEPSPSSQVPTYSNINGRIHYVETPCVPLDHLCHPHPHYLEQRPSTDLLPQNAVTAIRRRRVVFEIPRLVFAFYATRLSFNIHTHPRGTCLCSLTQRPS